MLRVMLVRNERVAFFPLGRRFLRNGVYMND